MIGFSWLTKKQAHSNLRLRGTREKEPFCLNVLIINLFFMD
jgi:hypothetical protein